MIEGRNKLLLIGHDNIFESSEVFDVDYYGSAARGMGKSAWGDTISLKQLLRNVLFRKYDYVILPEILLLRIGWQNPSSKKHRIAKAIYRLSYSSLFTWLTRKVICLFLKHKTVFFIGRFEQSGVHRQLFQFFPNARLYRTTSRVDLQEYDNLTVKPLNWWMNVGHYPEHELVPKADKVNDVFFVGGTSIKERQKVKLLQELCIKRDIRFYRPAERLSFDEFTKTLCVSKIAWSPEGTSWQCWRHYEALYYGAIPLINKPHDSIYNTLRHGKTALFYSSLEEAFELIEKVVSGELDLSLTLEERRQFVIDHHSEYSVRDYITREMLNTH
jgi:hypothetical protein